jgi:hypothetical protein
MYVLLAVWLIGILFPFYAFRSGWEPFERAIEWAFQTHLSHVLMHTVLYAVLAFILSVILRSASPFRVLLLVALIAFAQEYIQIVFERLRMRADEWFDIVVDINGGILGYSLHAFRRRKGRGLRQGADGLSELQESL